MYNVRLDVHFSVVETSPFFQYKVFSFSILPMLYQHFIKILSHSIATGII